MSKVTRSPRFFPTRIEVGQKQLGQIFRFRSFRRPSRRFRISITRGFRSPVIHPISSGGPTAYHVVIEQSVSISDGDRGEDSAPQRNPTSVYPLVAEASRHASVRHQNQENTRLNSRFFCLWLGAGGTVSSEGFGHGGTPFGDCDPDDGWENLGAWLPSGRRRNKRRGRRHNLLPRE